MSLTLVTDRTAADLAALAALRAKVVTSGWSALSAAEQAEWNGEHKGAYNASDLNRVGTAIDTLTTLLSTYGYTVSTAPKTDWAENQTPPTLAQMLQYLDDIRAIRQFAFKLTTPLVPANMQSLTIDMANNIELILFDSEQLINNMIAGFFQCGEFMCGEV